MLRWTRALALTLLLALVAAGCSGSEEPGATTSTTGADSAPTTDNGDGGDEVRGGTARLMAVAPPPSLDPAASMWGPISAYYETVYDTILRLDADGQVQAWLATDWEYDDSRTELTLSLRDDVTFTDGSALTAEVVVANLERFQAGSASGAPKLASIAAMEAADDHTVVLTLSQPDPGLLVALAQDAGLVASGEALDDPDLATQPVGSGPYVLDAGATVIGSVYVFEKNPDYWNPDAQWFDTIQIQAAVDPVGMVNAIRTNEIDLAQIGSEALQAAEESDWTIEVVDHGGFSGLMLFDRDGAVAEPLGDVRVRQAINHALDRPALIEAMTDGLGNPTVQAFTPGGQAYDESLDDRYPYDPETARELIAEAGYADGITVVIPDLGNRDSLLFIEQMLGDVGITVEFEESLLENSIVDILTGKYALLYFALGEATDWGTVQQLIAPDASFNPFRTTHPDLDPLIEQLRTGDEAAQAEAARAINELIVEEAWFAPIATSTSVIAHGPDVDLAVPTTTTYPSIYDLRPAA